MNCPKCEGVLRVTHSYEAGEGRRTQRLECDECGAICTAYSQIIEIEPDRGRGAAAVAKQMKNLRSGAEVVLTVL